MHPQLLVAWNNWTNIDSTQAKKEKEKMTQAKKKEKLLGERDGVENLSE